MCSTISDYDGSNTHLVVVKSNHQNVVLVSFHRFDMDNLPCDLSFGF